MHDVQREVCFGGAVLLLRPVKMTYWYAEPEPCVEPSRRAATLRGQKTALAGVLNRSLCRLDREQRPLESNSTFPWE